MQSRALLFFAWLRVWHTFALDEPLCRIVDAHASKDEFLTEENSQSRWHTAAHSSVAASFVQRETETSRGMKPRETETESLVEAEGLTFVMPTRTRQPSFGLLFIQVTLLAALLCIVLLITNLVLRDRGAPEPSKDQTWTQGRVGVGSLPRANDDLKIPSRSVIQYGTRGTPPSPVQSQLNPHTSHHTHQSNTAHHAHQSAPVHGGLQPMNRSISLPAQRQHPFSTSPGNVGRVPMLDLPPQGGSMHNYPSGVPAGVGVPIGMNLDDCPAWAALGTHSSMDSEEGMSFVTTPANSRPSTMPLNSHPGTAQGMFYPTPPRPVPEEGQPLGSGVDDERPNASRSFPPPMAPLSSPRPMSPPDSQRSDRLDADMPVVLQWYPQQPQSPEQPIESIPAWKIDSPSRAPLASPPCTPPFTPPATSASPYANAWTNATPARTRSLSPVPSSQSNRGNRMETTPSFAPEPAEVEQESGRYQDSVAESGSMAFVPHAHARPTLRAASSLDPMSRSASKAGFKGVGGIVQWFNLVTPRPGFVPSESAPIGSPPARRQPSKPSNIGS